MLKYKFIILSIGAGLFFLAGQLSATEASEQQSGHISPLQLQSETTNSQQRPSSVSSFQQNKTSPDLAPSFADSTIQFPQVTNVGSGMNPLDVLVAAYHCLESLPYNSPRRNNIMEMCKQYLAATDLRVKEMLRATAGKLELNPLQDEYIRTILENLALKDSLIKLKHDCEENMKEIDKYKRTIDGLTSILRQVANQKVPPRN